MGINIFLAKENSFFQEKHLSNDSDLKDLEDLFLKENMR
jgi:hypothetical protein